MPINRERRILKSLPLAKELAEKRRSREVPDNLGSKYRPIPVSDIRRRERAATSINPKSPPTSVREFEGKGKAPGSQAIASLSKERPESASSRSGEARQAALEKIAAKQQDKGTTPRRKPNLGLDSPKRIAMLRRLAANRKK